MLLPEREAMYGGAAGGGKSSALLMSALQYADVPGYAAILFRRTYADLSLPGALMDRAHEWLDPTDARWNEQTKTWAFPSGASLTFGYLENENDRFRYQSAEFQMIGFDELTQFSETQYRYLFSRLRRLRGAAVPLRMRAASNPGGAGHAWVKRRFLTEGQQHKCRFIPAKLTDNPYLDREGYASSLAEVDIITRKQLLDGDWDVTPEGNIARREWFPITHANLNPNAPRVRYWDMAATERSAKSDDPDYMVGTLMAMETGHYYIEHVIRGRWGPGDVERVIKQTAETDGRQCAIRWEQEGGASGKIVSGAMLQLLAGWDARPEQISGDKIQRAQPFLAQAEGGNVKLMPGEWAADWLDEMVSVPMGSHDDQWDSAAGAFRCLAQSAMSVSIMEY